MKIIGVIPARYGSTRFPGKPLADICGKPMIWWVYQQVCIAKTLDEVVVATDDNRVYATCKSYNIKVIMTSKDHDTPTSRLHEVNNTFVADYIVFVGGDEPLIEPEAIDAVVNEAMNNPKAKITHAMTEIKTAPEVIDFTNIKVVTNPNGYLLYTTRSPLPYPKGGLDFKYMKFVGIGCFHKDALDYYQKTPKSKLEKIEECDLLRFIEGGLPVKMVEVTCRNISVDTPKDLEAVRLLVESR